MTTIANMMDSFTRMRERVRSRRLLLEMDARMLKDIGVSRDIAAAEAAKPWWRD